MSTTENETLSMYELRVRWHRTAKTLRRYGITVASDAQLTNEQLEAMLAIVASEPVKEITP